MKNITHVIGITLLAIAGFFATHAGQAVLMQYPYLMSISSLIAMGAVYFNPKK